MNSNNVMSATLGNTAHLLLATDLKRAVELALEIQAIPNKGKFQRLANDARDLVEAITRCTEQCSDGAKTENPQDLRANLRNLVSTLSAIQRFAKKRAGKNKLFRTLMHIPDHRAIQKYRQELRQSLDLFRLKLTLDMQEGIAGLVKQQGELSKASKGPNLPNVSRYEQYGIETGRAEDPSVADTQSSRGQIEYVAVGGSVNHIRSLRHHTSVNSGNTTTTITENSNNRG